MSDEAVRSRSDWGILALAIASAILLGIGALLLLDDTAPDALVAFGVRVVVGLSLAIVAIWAVNARRYLGAAFAALLSGITPLAADWAWVAILSVVLAVWAIVILWLDIVNGRKW